MQEEEEKQMWERIRAIESLDKEELAVMKERIDVLNRETEIHKERMEDASRDSALAYFVGLAGSVSGTGGAFFNHLASSDNSQWVPAAIIGGSFFMLAGFFYGRDSAKFLKTVAKNEDELTELRHTHRVYQHKLKTIIPEGFHY